ncbi:LuxR family transcriptional regulator [Streptomyces amakusaensis]|uniref:AAA family ATPase n=1 Tax=Streptomyces amakusaensis TaxID=67271 RepID=A0ABW0AHY0_9ACTN
MAGMSLVERTEQLRFLAEALADERGPVGVVLIEGAAAVGKTSLLHAFADRAPEAGRVFLAASASRVERELPLSAVGRLFQSPVLTAVETARAEQLLREGALAALSHGPGLEPDAAVRVPGRILEGLGAVLLAAAGRTPLVIGIDDVHHADAASLHLLLHLVRRAAAPRLLLVLTQCMRTSRPHPLLHAELLRRPGARRLRLEPLSPRGVAALLAGHLAPPAAERLAAECHTATGGNPLLAHALIEDTLAPRPGLLPPPVPVPETELPDAAGLQDGPPGTDPAAPAPVSSLVFGEAFRQAVLTCLFHSEASAFARAAAVLGEDASDAALGELVQYDAESISLARGALRATGLLGDEGFAHPAVPAAVLGGMRPQARTALYVRVAQVLHGHGAPARVVARRLLAADRAGEPWAVEVLRDAARQAWSDGEPTHAIACLRLALQECADEQRPAVLLDLARAEWQLDPAIAARRLPGLIRAIGEGRLPAASAVRPVSWLLWLGRVDEAVGLMDGPPDPAARSCGPGGPLWWLRYGYPGLARPAADGEPARAPAVPAATAGGTAPVALPSPLARSRETAALLAGVLPPGDPGETIDRAEHILRQPGHSTRTLKPLAAIAALMYTDELDRAERACDRVARSVAHGLPLGNALFMSLRAAIHLRRGELERAEKFAHEALGLITPQGWGVALGIPLSVMLATLTARGRHEEFEEYFATPVPDAMFHTPSCLPYLQARGRYYLVIDRPQAALADFQACGELMTRWEIDVPGFLSWRTDLAEAHLALGDAATAGRLAGEQLKRLKPGQFRTRGMTLRVLAAACEPHARVKALGAAVRLLEKSGDRLELARALTDLGAVYDAQGHDGPARAMGQRARLLAAECGAEDLVPLRTPLTVPREPLPPAPYEESDPLAGLSEAERRVAGLSEAERRVAGLAAGGYTNRQIAHRLHITMSTVEQHLTRVYRKLDVSRRTDLPLHLMLPLEGYQV